MRPRGGRDAGSPAAAGGTAPSESRETASGGDSGSPLAALGTVLEASRPSEEGSLAKRFRLAGTILGASTGGAGEPMAVIDDRETVRQCVVVRSMEVVPGVVLSAVGQDFAVLSGPNGEETLRLGEKGAARGSGPASRPGSADAPRGGTAPALSSREEAAAKFGGMEVFPDRWRFDREKVIAYYEELRSEPERLLAVFDSMDPVYVQDDLTGERRIEGYEVGVEGENDFFLAAGLK
ncbi:MAG: hypothetical protein IJS46_04170, partial [Kiritimatiellae bacterium]|nr:hypothetical protein [Kiritimatiellia bacterium]